jgi:hypothetical protein
MERLRDSAPRGTSLTMINATLSTLTAFLKPLISLLILTYLELVKLLSLRKCRQLLQSTRTLEESPARVRSRLAFTVTPRCYLRVQSLPITAVQTLKILSNAVSGLHSSKMTTAIPAIKCRQLTSAKGAQPASCP